MKKLFFSAVALVAFSSVSMGNNVADEEENSININSIENVTIAVDYWSCAKIANIVYVELLENFSAEEAMDNANAYFEDCMYTPPCRPPFTC